MWMKARCSCRETIAAFTPELVKNLPRSEQRTMSKLSVFVGLDYHSDSIQVCVMDRTGQVVSNQKCPNDAHVVSALVRVHGDDIHGAIEACTGAAALADEL